MLSNLHINIINYIKQNYSFLSIKTEHKFKNFSLRVDIFLPEILLGIEIQGIQHYENNSFFYKNNVSFLDSNLRDLEKLNYFKKNNLNILYIKYNDKNYITKINKKINELILKMENNIIYPLSSDKYTEDDLKNVFCHICKNPLNLKNAEDDILGNVKIDSCCGLDFIFFKIKKTNKKWKFLKQKSLRGNK